ncbi:MAG TPA: hypothetical protein VG737_00485 [Cyclobacteriaceae bacterium]|nr:hypothetical protein [Cyclobacteriaceae bacterium]
MQNTDEEKARIREELKRAFLPWLGHPEALFQQMSLFIQETQLSLHPS